MLLPCPFPYFCGKSRIAGVVWELFGDAKNYVEPFAGSLAVLLNRPSPFSGSETVNDVNCFLVNAWRAIVAHPAELSELLIAPVSEVETEATHAALIRAEPDLRTRLGEVEYCDLRLAAWWIKGANEWIGSGWCSGEGPWTWSSALRWKKRGDAGTGINRKLPHLGDAGKGINRQLPHLGDAGAFASRRDFVADWLSALRDRLCSVRIACGDWRRICGESVTTKHGSTAVFLDPPYEGTEYVYGEEKNISAECRQWCLDEGENLKLRIVIAGRGDEHDSLLAQGWRKQGWSALRGYAKHEERKDEAIWCSPGCCALEKVRDLFSL
jgi:DNA adenine methylase